MLLVAINVAGDLVAQDGIDRYIQPRKKVRQKKIDQARFEEFSSTASNSKRSVRPKLRQLTTPQYRATVKQHHSQLIIADQKIARIAVTAPEIVNFLQYSETEVALIGLNVGSTDLTLWFEGNPEPVMYEITVHSGTPKASSPHAALGEVNMKLRSVFPRSRVQLIPVADQIVVKGQAWDAAQAKQIMQIVEKQFTGDRTAVVNMLNVPGEFQVMLRVRIAELNRTQLRRLGVNSRDLFSKDRKSKSFGPTTAGVSGVFENREIDRVMKWLSSNGTISYLAEPTLTVLSGHSASFLSGGEYAVPTVVRDGERQTEFRNFGTKLKVTPTIVDRDLIRLQIAPEFSQISDKNAVNGVPGTNVRRVETVIELREGQTMAIGGLVSRQMQTEVSRKPGLRPRWFTRRATEADTELLIVVTPEIVRPMDPTEVPPLPNYYVTRPSDAELFLEGRSEGVPLNGPPASGRFEALQFGTQCPPGFAGAGPGIVGPGIDTRPFSFGEPLEVNRSDSVLPAPLTSAPPAQPQTYPQPGSAYQPQPDYRISSPAKPTSLLPSAGAPPVPPDSSQGTPTYVAPPANSDSNTPLFEIPSGRDTPHSAPTLPSNQSEPPISVMPDSASLTPAPRPVSIVGSRAALSTDRPNSAQPRTVGERREERSVSNGTRSHGSRSTHPIQGGGHSGLARPRTKPVTTPVPQPQAQNTPTSPVLRIGGERPVAELPRIGHSILKPR